MLTRGNAHIHIRGFFQIPQIGLVTHPQVPCVTQKGSKELDLRKWLELGAAPSFQH